MVMVTILVTHSANNSKKNPLIPLPFYFIIILYYLLLHHSILGSVQVVYWFYSFIQLNNFDLINLLLINFNYLIALLIINN